LGHFHILSVRLSIRSHSLLDVGEFHIRLFFDQAKDILQPRILNVQGDTTIEQFLGGGTACHGGNSECQEHKKLCQGNFHKHVQFCTSFFILFFHNFRCFCFCPKNRFRNHRHFTE